MSGDLGFEIDERIERIDFEKATAMLAQTYWSPGIPLEKVRRAAEHSSLVLGAYADDVMVGYCRVVSDRTTFAWVCDVIVDENYRRRGIAGSLVRYAQAHPEHQDLRRWILATRDAHDVYRPCGFEVVTNPERWMAYFPPGSIGPV